MKKKIITTLFVVVLLGVITGIVDYNRIRNNEMPIFMFEVSQHPTEQSLIYIGLGYKFQRKAGVSANEPISSSSNLKFGFWLYVWGIPTPNGNKRLSYVIVDETKVCEESLEEIWRDFKYIYYLPCLQSKTIFLKYENGDKISIKEALAKGREPIYDLIDAGLEVIIIPIAEPQND